MLKVIEADRNYAKLIKNLKKKVGGVDEKTKKKTRTDKNKRRLESN